MTAAVSQIRCHSCGNEKPTSEFVGTRREFVKNCASCREKHTSESRTRDRLGLGARPKRESLTRLEAIVREEGRVHLAMVTELDARRPKKRGDCEPCEGCQAWRDADEDARPTSLTCGHTPAEAIRRSRPCVFASCRSNLYLDADPDTGSIQFTWPDKEPEEIDPGRSCALDIADDGGATLEDVGRLLNVTREGIRQLEVSILRTVERASLRRGSAAQAFVEHGNGRWRRERRDLVVSSSVLMRSMKGKAPSVGESAEVEASEFATEEQPARVSFFAPGDSADGRVTDSVWSMFSRKHEVRSESSRRMTAYWKRKRVRMSQERFDALVATGEAGRRGYPERNDEEADP